MALRSAELLRLRSARDATSRSAEEAGRGGRHRGRAPSLNTVRCFLGTRVNEQLLERGEDGPCSRSVEVTSFDESVQRGAGRNPCKSGTRPRSTISLDAAGRYGDEANRFPRVGLVVASLPDSTTPCGIAAPHSDSEKSPFVLEGGG